MITRAEHSYDEYDLVHLLFRHKTKVLAWCGVVMAISLAAVILLPRSYQSEAKVFLRIGRESVTLDPTVTTGTTLPLQESREHQIISTRDMMKSRALLETVVDKLGAENFVPELTAGRPAGLAGLLATLGDKFTSLRDSILPQGSLKDRAILELSKTLDVGITRSSSVITVNCRADSPELAQQTLKVYLEAYQKQHLAANSTAGALEFFDAQAKDLKEQLDTATAKLRDVKSDSNIVSIPVEQQALQSQATQVEAGLLAAQASLTSSEASIDSLRKSVKDLPEQLTTQKTIGFPNAAADYMRQDFFKFQISMRELETKLGEDHPLVKLARDQSRKLEETLNAQDKDRVQTTTGVNTARQSLDLELRREEALAQSYRAKAVSLKEQYAGMLERMRSLNAHEVQIAEMQRQTDIADVTYRSYIDHLEQARIGQALEAQQISNVNVVQPPSFEEAPVRPRPAFIFCVGWGTAVCGSLVLAFYSEYRARVARRREERSRIGANISTRREPMGVGVRA